MLWIPIVAALAIIAVIFIVDQVIAWREASALIKEVEARNREFDNRLNEAIRVGLQGFEAALQKHVDPQKDIAK